MTAGDLISGALKLLGVLAAGETATADDAQDALSRLNDLVDSWSLDRLFLFTVVRTLKTLTANTASYTIGTGGDINIVRPTWIDHVGLIIDVAATTPTEIPIKNFTLQEWEGIQQKSQTSTLSQGIYYDHDWNAGLGRLSPWPIPSVSTTQLALYAPGVAVGEFANLTTQYTFPPGYRRALRYNLAIELAPEFGREPTSSVVAIANESRGAVKRANNRPKQLVVDEALLTGSARGAYDWRTNSTR